MSQRVSWPSPFPREPRTTHHPVPRVVGVVLVLLLLLANLPTRDVSQAQPAKTVTTCASTVRGFTVSVCLTAPAPNDPIRENPVISATVEVSDPDIRVLSVDFDLDERRALSDFDPPYQFELPTRNWVDGVYSLSAVARTSDKEKSSPVVTEILLSTGTETAPSPNQTFTPATGRPAAEGSPFVLAAVGDAAGGSPQSAAVTDLIASWDPNLMLYLGDIYNSGTYAEFMNWYEPDEYVGRFADVTLPTIGNHEYSGCDQPRGYLQYWGDPPHYYSVDTAGWHLVSLDSNSKFDEVAPETQQMQWLVDDLESSNAACTLVFFHHPPFTVGSHDDTEAFADLWKILVKHDVTLVVTGHDHNYQRWNPLDASGKADPNGTVSLVVGTGGQSEYAATREDDRLAGPLLTDTGALRLELNTNGAAFQFITTTGVVRDSDVVSCSQPANDSTPPSTPGQGNALRQADGSVVLRWLPATDDTGIAQYDVYRNGVLIGSVTPGSTLVDSSAETDAGIAYEVVARDAANNASARGDPFTASGTHDPEVLFADSFAAGSLGRWTEVDGLAIEQDPASTTDSGWVARGRGGIHPTFARIPLLDEAAGADDASFTITLRFFVLEQGPNAMTLIRIRSPDDESLFGVSINADGTLGIFNDVLKTGFQSSTEVNIGMWHVLTLGISTNSGRAILATALDGEPVPELSGPIDLEAATFGLLQLGDSSGNRIYDVQFAEIRVEGPPGDAPATPTPASAATSVPGKHPGWVSLGVALPATSGRAVSRLTSWLWHITAPAASLSRTKPAWSYQASSSGRPAHGCVHRTVSPQAHSP